MPMVWVEPDLILEHKGISVYFTYNHDTIRQYHFTTDINEDPDYEFDIRDLPEYPGDDKWNIWNMPRVRDVFRAAINNGHIKACDKEE